MRWARPAPRTVLVVEPDEATLAAVTEALGSGSRVVVARSPAEAEVQLAEAEPGLVLLGLPPCSGLELCRRIRAGSAKPIIFLAGFDPDDEALPSYSAGADGYIRKPYRLRELDARIQAALRHSFAASPPDLTAITVDDVTLDLERHEVQVRGSVVSLPLREFQLLSVFLAHPGKVWTREALMRRIWGETPASGTKSLDVHVRRIRSRIEDDPSSPTRILTVRGVGYRYAPAFVMQPSLVQESPAR